MVSSDAGKGTKENSWKKWRNRRRALLYICTMKGVRFHLKLAKGRGFRGVGEREAKGQAARNLSTWKRKRASSGESRGGARGPALSPPPSPLLTFRPNCRPEKKFFETASPLFHGLDDRAPTLLKVWICHCRQPNDYQHRRYGWHATKYCDERRCKTGNGEGS